MKKLSILCAFALVLVLMAGPVFAVEYCKDILEIGNTGGPSGDKTWDDAITVSPGDTITVDIWMNDAPGLATAGGCKISWTGPIAYVSGFRYDANSTPVGPWLPSGLFSQIGSELVCANAAGAPGLTPDGDGDIIVAQITLECTGAGTASFTVGVIPAQTTWGPSANGWDDGAISDNTVIVTQVVECQTDDDCNDGLWCTTLRTCDTITTPLNPVCVGSLDNPCATPAEDCDLEGCTEDNPGCGKECSTTPMPCMKDADCPGSETCTAGSDCEATPGTCDNGCDEAEVIATGGSTSACCADGELCSGTGSDPSAICSADVTLIKDDGYYQPPAWGEVATIKNPVCLDNPDNLVGGIQFDLCDSPDCLECVDCELTERTVMFDCEAVELANGCCRVLMFCKNPGCAINPGLCDIVTVVLQTKAGAPAACDDVCIEETFENIVVSDYDGFELAGAGTPGVLCPVSCGDICPPGAGTSNDCGDGVVDIYDIMCEVDFALADDPMAEPNACQLPRADVPTGTPPECTAPDGAINILDIMVLIDMALNRQDCCTFYYTGIMY